MREADFNERAERRRRAALEDLVISGYQVGITAQDKRVAHGFIVPKAVPSVAFLTAQRKNQLIPAIKAARD
jgi:hypothetical protein